jgi:hypothetical protein
VRREWVVMVGVRVRRVEGGNGSTTTKESKQASEEIAKEEERGLRLGFGGGQDELILRRQTGV